MLLMKKRGQVAIFALLGLVLLVTVSFLLLITASLTTTELQERAREAVRDYLAGSPVNYYVNLCLEQATNEALIELGRQGGVFWEHQGGPYVIGDIGKTHINWTTTDGEPHNVSYGILRPYIYDERLQTPHPEKCGILEIHPPSYPFSATSFNRMTRSHYPSHCSARMFVGGGFIGTNVMPRLCYAGSLNSLQIFFAPVGSEFGCGGMTGRLLSDEQNLSMEYLLSQRILNLTLECIDFELFKDLDGDTIEFIEDEERSMHLLFEPEGFNSNLVLPFRVALRGHVPVITSYSFSYNSNVRLQEMHRYLFELLKEDTISPFFNISFGYDTLSMAGIALFKSGFEIEVISFEDQENQPYRWDRLIKLTDNRSIINAENFTYYVAIQNRNPVLEYITSSDHPDLHIIVYENQSILIEPNAIDPDNRLINFNYSGWRETTTSVLKPDSWPCTRPFSSIAAIGDCMDESPCVDCKNWTRSALFQETNRSAKINTTEVDLGLHTVTVIVTDPSGLQDYQDVQILVIDNMEIKMEISNFYEQNDHIFSIENPLLFNASESEYPSLLIGSFTHFQWTLFDQDRNSLLTFQNEDINLVLPTPPNILTIHNEELKNPGVYSMELGIQFSPEFVDILGIFSKKDFQFEVFQCLDHTSSDPPFPYNQGNAFLADHACCEGNSRLGNTDVCYEDTKWGNYRLLLERAQEKIDIKKEEIEQEGFFFDIYEQDLGPWDNLAMENRNNIYKLEFERYCDGQRGNICVGPVSYTITQVGEACDYDTSTVAQCTGPLTLLIEGENELCWWYGSGTYFNVSSMEMGGGRCKTEPALSVPNDPTGYNDPFGTHICMGANCNGGQCQSTVGIQCQCEKGRGGAVCDATNDVDWSGTTCRYGCSDACGFENEEQLPCNHLEQSCYNETYNGIPACYFEVTCGPAPNYQQVNCVTGQEVNEFGDTVCRYLAPLHNRCVVSGGNNVCQTIVTSRVLEEVEAAYPTSTIECDKDYGWRDTNTGHILN